MRAIYGAFSAYALLCSQDFLQGLKGNFQFVSKIKITKNEV